MGDWVVQSVNSDGLRGDTRREGQSAVQGHIVCISQGHSIGCGIVYGALGASYGAYQRAATSQKATSDRQEERSCSCWNLNC